MRTIAKRGKKGKQISNRRAVQIADSKEWGDINAKVALIQALIPLGLKAVAEALDGEVVALAGERYQRVGRQPGYARWTAQRGWVYMGGQKLPVRVPRIRDQRAKVEVPLQT